MVTGIKTVKKMRPTRHSQPTQSPNFTYRESTVPSGTSATSVACEPCGVVVHSRMRP
jgi:hypothetical protein